MKRPTHIALVYTESDAKGEPVLLGFTSREEVEEWLRRHAVQFSLNPSAVAVFEVGAEVPITWTARHIMWPHLEKKE